MYVIFYVYVYIDDFMWLLLSDCCTASLPLEAAVNDTGFC